MNRKGEPIMSNSEQKTDVDTGDKKNSTVSDKGEQRIQDYKDQFGDEFDPIEDPTDAEGNSFDPELHRTHKGCDVPVLSAKGNLYRKKGKASSGSKETDADPGTKESKVKGAKKSRQEKAKEEQLERERSQAEKLVDDLIELLDTDEHETSERQRDRLVDAQTKFHRRYFVIEYPFLIEYSTAWGLWLKPRLIGGPGGLAGLWDIYERLGLVGNDEEEDEDQGPLSRVEDVDNPDDVPTDQGGGPNSGMPEGIDKV